MAPLRTLIGRVLGVHTEEGAWRQGARGEELVAARLEHLPHTWKVLHDITLDEAEHNVDHLVIGPGGIFSLNAKNLTGSVWVAERAVQVNGKRTDYIRKAEWEAKQVARCLGTAIGFAVDVRPVIVVIAQKLTIKSQPAHVSVVGRKRIARWLIAQPAWLDEGEIHRLGAVAGEGSTWR